MAKGGMGNGNGREEGWQWEGGGMAMGGRMGNGFDRVVYRYHYMSLSLTG